MATSSRRSFLQAAAIGAVATGIAGRARSDQAAKSERVRLGVIGCGGQGGNHIRTLMGMKDAQIVYVADVDRERQANAEKESAGAKGVTDFRRILDDPSIDGVTIATPDHWHAPVALLALAAGKHVYVEKPAAHNIRECQLLVAATKKFGKVVAHGTQSRSSPSIKQATQLLHDGTIGDVLIAKCWDWQMRQNIGHMQPSEPPVGVDYDMWVGPAEWLPFQANRFHYNWHWWHNFGCGDLGNDGIHDVDIALWGLGVKSHPSTISAIGGKYFFNDDQQFPDTMQVTFEFLGDGKPGSRRLLIYEQRLWSTTYPYNVDSGIEYIGTKGKMFLSKRGKFEIRGEHNQPLDVKLSGIPRCELVENIQNWLECIRSGKLPNANIDVAHHTAMATHLGNIAARLGRTIHFNPANERIVGDDEATALISRKYRSDGHWATPAGV